MWKQLVSLLNTAIYTFYKAANMMVLFPYITTIPILACHPGLWSLHIHLSQDSWRDQIPSVVLGLVCYYSVSTITSCPQIFSTREVSFAHGVSSVGSEPPWNGNCSLPHTPEVSAEGFKEYNGMAIYSSLLSSPFYKGHWALSLVRGDCCPVRHCHLSAMLPSLC